jgi:hypothetical protein
MPFTTQDSNAAMNVIKFIVFLFGVPNIIITCKNSKFISCEFEDYCNELGIKLRFASVAHP